jgi:topoisomerase-4 subunit A
MDEEYKDELDDNELDEYTPEETEEEDRGELHTALHLSGMYENWFLDYASYVILERAVPDIHDGLKPVHRRILHSMKEMDDGRYNKVANIIGNTMKYHPHGDASIGDALVNLGQKDLLIDAQGNWGNILTGDRAAAPRYIEARLSKFALAVVFNPKTTTWKSSYDGRNNEPISLPVKFPLLLAQGVEGIAVGLASKILPHNFVELIDASIAILRNKSFELYPDFLTGGLMDVARYKDGLRGGKILVRARIIQENNKLLKIVEIPFSKTTSNLIDSIISANEKGKIKIKKIDDNTSENVEILLHLAPGVSPDQTIDALYAFTDCEISISPNSCIIHNDKPHFIGMREILKFSTDQTANLLKRELEIHRGELLEQLHNLSLEKIFIEERIYRDIESCESFEEVIVAIDEGLKPFVKDFIRDISRDDIIRLTEIKIKRISKYNSFKADESIQSLREELKKVEFHLAHLIDYAIDYFKDIKKRFGKGRERKTEIRSFESINAATVAVANTKYYVNREDGFVGISLKKDEYVGLCSDIDDIIVFLADGSFIVTKISPKSFVGKNIIHVEVFNKNDNRTTYNMIYRDGKRGNYYVKRFPVTSITRDRNYSLTKGTDGSKVVYFTANPNGEAELIKVYLRSDPKIKKTSFDFDFKELAIKGRGAKGNIISKKAIKKIVLKESGVSTLGAIDIWYDDTVKRLNTEERGIYLGAFKGDDKIFTVSKTGHYQLYSYDISNHFDDHMILIEKYDPRKVMSAIYIESQTKLPYVKRFRIEETDRKICFVGDEHARLLEFSLDYLAQLKVEYKNTRERKNFSEIINLDEFIAVKSLKAKGKRLTNNKIKSLSWEEPLQYEYPSEEDEKADEVLDKLEERARTEDQKQKGEQVFSEVRDKGLSQKITVEAKLEEQATDVDNILPKGKNHKNISEDVDTSYKSESEKPNEANTTIELEIEIDDSHILIDDSRLKKPKSKKGISKKRNINPDNKTDGQITLDFE